MTGSFGALSLHGLHLLLLKLAVLPSFLVGFLSLLLLKVDGDLRVNIFLKLSLNHWRQLNRIKLKLVGTLRIFRNASFHDIDDSSLLVGCE